jgi:hypothetical protein
MCIACQAAPTPQHPSTVPRNNRLDRLRKALATSAACAGRVIGVRRQRAAQRSCELDRVDAIALQRRNDTCKLGFKVRIPHVLCDKVRDSKVKRVRRRRCRIQPAARDVRHAIKRDLGDIKRVNNTPAVSEVARASSQSHANVEDRCSRLRQTIDLKH